MDGITQSGGSSLSRSSRSYLFTLCSSSVFVSRLCQKLCSKSAIIVKGGKLTRTFHRIYMRKKPVPLSLSLRIAYGINDESARLNLYHRSLLPKSSRLLHSNQRRNRLEPRRYSASHSKSTARVSRRHGLLTAQDCCSPSGFIGVIRFVRATCPGISLTAVKL